MSPSVPPAVVSPTPGAALRKLFALSQPQVPAFVQIKVAKVYADVGKQDWPRAFPSFFESIYQLLEER